MPPPGNLSLGLRRTLWAASHRDHAFNEFRLLLGVSLDVTRVPKGEEHLQRLVLVAQVGGGSEGVTEDEVADPLGVADLVGMDVVLPDVLVVVDPLRKVVAAGDSVFALVFVAQ